MSNRAGAHITKIDAGHLSLISHPGAVTGVIDSRGPGHRLIPEQLPYSREDQKHHVGHHRLRSTADRGSQCCRAHSGRVHPRALAAAASWDRWRAVFEEAGYATLAPGWPDDPEHRRGGEQAPRGLRPQEVGQIADHFGDVIGKLTKKPALIGHSFGGLITQILAGRGAAAVSVAIDPAPFRGVLPLPISALKSAAAGDRQPGQPRPRRPAHLRPVPVRLRQRRQRGRGPRTATRPSPCRARVSPLFQAASANLNPWTEAKVDTKNPDRGPLLIIDGEMDHTVPWAIANASYKRQKRNPGVTEIVKIPGRGHSLTIDHGWREVADIALAFVQKHAQP